MSEIEFGSVSGVLFPGKDNWTLKDGDGNIILCKCGNSAECGMFGKEAYVAYCSHCAPLSKHAEKFVYKPADI